MPAALWFKARYVEPILSGRKRQTLRRATKLSRGDEVPLTVGPRPPFARVKIGKVDRVALGDLTESDAKVDGFGSLADLLAEIRRTYPGCRSLSRIRFRLLD